MAAKPADKTEKKYPDSKFPPAAKLCPLCKSKGGKGGKKCPACGMKGK